MKVSAVVCTLARERELERCMESIRSQSRKPDEIVIVSDRKLDKGSKGYSGDQARASQGEELRIEEAGF